MRKLREAPDLRVGVRKLWEAPDLSDEVEARVVDADYSEDIASLGEWVAKLQQSIEQVVNAELDTRGIVNRLEAEVKEASSHSVEVSEPEVGKKDISATQKTIVMLRGEVQRVADEIAGEIKRLDAGIEEVGYRKSVKYVGGGPSLGDIKNDSQIAELIGGGETDLHSHAAGEGDMTKAVYDPEDEGAIRLTPRISSSGAEGTIFYCSNDDHVYVGTA